MICCRFADLRSLDVCQPAISNQVVWVYLSFNVSTDLYLLSIPLPMLWQAKLKPLKKWGLLFLFSGGLFVIVCATLRCVLIVTVSCCPLSALANAELGPLFRIPKMEHNLPARGQFEKPSSLSLQLTCQWSSPSSNSG